MKKLVASTLFILITSGYYYFQAQPDGLLHVYFLNVGQGDATLIRTPTGENILIDGGPKNTVLGELKEILPPLDAEIALIILTHPHKDHIEGLLSVISRYSVKKILISGTYDNKYFIERFLKLAAAKKITVMVAEAKTDFSAGEVMLDILYPFVQKLAQEENPHWNNIVARLTYGENEILFTGDAETDIEEKLIATGAPLNADILKVGHHGSLTSTSEAFLQAVTPEYSVIMAGKGNTYHLPNPKTLEHLKQFHSKILRTDKDGRIEMIFSAERMVALNCGCQYQSTR